MTHLCPRCDGNRTIFKWDAWLLTLALPIALLIERDQEEGITKTKCPRCKGRGYIKIQES